MKNGIFSGRVKLDTYLLKSERLNMGLSQEGLADYCYEKNINVSLSTIKRAELGRNVLVRTARELATVYNLSIANIIINWKWH